MRERRHLAATLVGAVIASAGCGGDVETTATCKQVQGDDSALRSLAQTAYKRLHAHSPDEVGEKEQFVKMAVEQMRGSCRLEGDPKMRPYVTFVTLAETVYLPDDAPKAPLPAPRAR